MIQWLLSFAIAVVFCGQCCWGDGASQELFCKDPDTAQYHPVNSTWRSTTFCGNYTCKVRPKNNTATEYIPYVAIDNDTHVMGKGNEVIGDDNKTTPKEEIDCAKKVSMKAMSADLSKIFHKIDKDGRLKSSAQANVIDREFCYKCNEALDPEDDRYLNTEEVNSISKFLYSVKKSDLDALVEMYKIANDMYGEMESSATEDTSEVVTPMHTLPSMQAQLPQNVQTYYAIQPIVGTSPYLYNPYAYSYNKQDYFQDPRPVTVNPYSYLSTQYQRSLYSSPQVQPFPVPLINAHIQPIQQVQSHLEQENSLNKIKSDSSKMYVHPYSLYSGVQSYPYNINSKLVPTEAHLMQDHRVSISKFSQPSVLYSTGVAPPSKLYFANPTPYVPQTFYNLSTNPYMPLTQVPVQYAATANNYRYGQQPGYFGQNAFKEETRANEVPKWKTGPLSAKTLDSVRAHVIQKTPSLLSRPRRLLQPGVFNSTKRIKLEKIGKVLRLEGLKRTKRNVSDDNIKMEKENIEEEIKQIEEKINVLKEESLFREVKRQENETLETYISADRCELATEPGFFRAGDNRLPFPQCCPQRLKDPID